MSKSDKEKNKADKELKAIKQNKRGKTAKELMTRHIVNEDDVISDEDFKNLVIDVEITSDVAHHPLEITNDPDRPKDEDKDPKISTPWDVIN